MTMASLARCDYCGETLPVNETFHPVPSITRCRDVADCDQRQIRRYDPTLQDDWARPSTPAAAPAGARCANCGTAGDLYNGGNAYFCRDRAGCELRAKQDMSAWSDESPDRLIAAADMMRLSQLAGAQIPPAPTVLDPAEMAALAAQEALGRKRPGSQRDVGEIVARAARGTLGA
jgi:hypothetical protein